MRNGVSSVHHCSSVLHWYPQHKKKKKQVELGLSPSDWKAHRVNLTESFTSIGLQLSNPPRPIRANVLWFRCLPFLIFIVFAWWEAYAMMSISRWKKETWQANDWDGTCAHQAHEPQRSCPGSLFAPHHPASQPVRRFMTFVKFTSCRSASFRYWRDILSLSQRLDLHCRPNAYLMAISFFFLINYFHVHSSDAHHIWLCKHETTGIHRLPSWIALAKHVHIVTNAHSHSLSQNFFFF